jgi:hydroxymethylpyrimidine/phosphomethylpyrimidine kinase
MPSPLFDAKNTAPAALLTIAGFDPSSGAGITADLAVFSAFGAFGVSCIAALTVQSTTGVTGVEPVPAATVKATLASLAADLPLGGIKIGMMGTAENVRILAGFCAENPGLPVVLDPVWRSSSGYELLDPAGVKALQEELLGKVSWITPNLDELGMLTSTTVRTAGDVPDAAAKLQKQAAALGNPGLKVVVTGGHLDSADDFLLGNHAEAGWIPGKWVETTSTHGTGCAFSSALLAGLVMHPERTAAEQVVAAKEYVRRALETAIPLGHGAGPMNLLWPLRSHD